MDGGTWNVETAEGKHLMLILNRDGSGIMYAPMTVAIKWEIRNQDICLDLRAVGIKCVRFRQVAGGYYGYRDETIELRFAR